jgi:predicted ATPase
MIDTPALRAKYEEHFQELVNLARDNRPPKYQLAHIPAAPDASRALQIIFTQWFKYLGPLRDEPKPVYPMQGAVDPSDVGLRGEFTAAVLDLHKFRKIRSIPSACFATSGASIIQKEMSLQDAVLDWLNYLGVVCGVETRDKGVFGHELLVAPGNTEMLHNLVHVGVGVSQVLPILVMSLMADPESVLVFEQPELHLHPKVQTLLADFLLSMALLGKQCIVETHSEYLINRLRLRAAEDPADKIQDLFALYFVEKDKEKSRYRFVNVNEYGAIGDWPAGFFDQAPQEAERILRAALEKRRNRRLKNV